MQKSYLTVSHSPAGKMRGLSLVELMVGMTVGLLVIATVASLFASNSRTRQEMEKTAQQIENGRYATQTLLEDFQLSGYYGEFNPTSLATPAAKPNPCATDSVNLKVAVSVPVQGYDNGVSIPACVADVKAGTDIVVVRRASTCTAGAAGCDAADPSQFTYFQVPLCAGQAGQFVIDNNASGFTMTAKDCTTAAALRSYYTRIYFVANNNQAGDGIPTLKVAELVSGAFVISPLVAGIEQLQLEYGIDTDDNGSPDTYTADPDLYDACAGIACQTNWRRVTAIKINILARNTQTTSGFVDNRSYTMGLQANGAQNTFGPFNDGYKRHFYTTLARLNNVAGRLE